MNESIDFTAIQSQTVSAAAWRYILISQQHSLSFNPEHIYHGFRVIICLNTLKERNFRLITRNVHITRGTVQ